MNSTNYFNGRISGSLQFLSAGYQVGRPLVPEGFVVCFLLVAAWGSMAAAVQPNSPGEHLTKPLGTSGQGLAAPPGTNLLNMGINQQFVSQ